MKIPRIETLILFVFLGCLMLWAVSKCSARRTDITRRMRSVLDENEEHPGKRDTVFVPQTLPQVQQQIQVQTTQVQPQTQQIHTPVTPNGTLPKIQDQPSTPIASAPKQTPAPQSPPPAAANPNSKYSTLYVTIDGLNMRKTPNLQGDVVAKLELYEPVYFLNQKTEKTEEISLGYEKVTDHWVKIRTKSGKDGWVFGAGVHYYKMKRKGVIGAKD